MSVSVSLFGWPRADVDGIEIKRFRSDRIPLLIAFLSFEGGSASRDTIAHALWPQAANSLGLHNLRQTLLYARQLLGDRCFDVSRRSIALTPLITVDLADFRKRLGYIGAHPEESFSVDPVLEITQMTLLDGFDDEWVVDARKQLRAEAVRALAAHAGALITSSPHEALDLATSLLEIEPSSVGARSVTARVRIALGEDIGLDSSPVVSKTSHDTTSGLAHEDLVFSEVIPRLIRLNRIVEAEQMVVSAVPVLTTIALAQKGLAWLEEAERAKTAPGSQTHRQRVELAKATLEFTAGRSMEALSIVQAAITASSQSETRVRALLLMGRLELRLYRTRKAKRWLTEAEQLAKAHQMDDEWLSARALSVEVAYQAHEYKRCERLGLQTIQACRERSDLRTEISVLISVAQAQATLGEDRSRALESVERCENLLNGSAFGDQIDLRLRLARVREEAGDLSGAIRGYRHGSDLAGQSGESFLHAVGLTYLGDALTRLGSFDEASAAHSEALAIRAPLDDRLGCASSHRGLARAALLASNLQKGDFSLLASGLSSALRASELFSELKDLNGYTSSLLLLALIQDARGKHRLAKKTAVRAIQLLDSLPKGSASLMGSGFEKIIEQVRMLPDLADE